MKDRIKKLRKKLGLTQQQFADRIGIKRNTVANYEAGRNVPIDSVFTLICREFHVNAEWLRQGKGLDDDMFVEDSLSPMDQIVEEFNLTPRENILIQRFLCMKPEIRSGIIDYILDVAAEINSSGISCGATDEVVAEKSNRNDN